VISTFGPHWPLWVGHGVFIGFLGIGAINAPLYVYVSHWFDRRRGSALALISSGNNLAGAVWPPIFEMFIAQDGWRQTMLLFAAAQVLVVVPLAVTFFVPHPKATGLIQASQSSKSGTSVIGLSSKVVFAMMCCAMVLCCIPMAIPPQHLVAFCSDFGISRSVGAVMLSVLLGAAFLSRQVWGAISDRIGGLATVLIGSISQCLAMIAFLLTQDEIGLFIVAGAFGLGFSGIIPAYLLAVRELFPPAEAYWRLPTLLLASAIGMALGGWLGGILYDRYGYYAPAFAAGIGANILNIAIISILVTRARMRAAFA
jgi:MFS family permease